MDHDAYREESPLPSQERLYLYYLRNRKKAEMRRSAKSSEDESRYLVQDFSEYQLRHQMPTKRIVANEIELSNIGSRKP